MAVGAASLAVLWLTCNPGISGISGIVYFTLLPLHTALGFLGGKRASTTRRSLLETEM